MIHNIGALMVHKWSSVGGGWLGAQLSCFTFTLDHG